MDGMIGGMDAATARRTIRTGRFRGPTAGLAPGCIQGNIIILPAAASAEFVAFCGANPQSCPLLAVSSPGDPSLPDLGTDIDIRHDVPGYRLLRAGHPPEELPDIAHLWRDDLVTHVIGCSYTFEAALLAAGIPLRHVTEGRAVAMYRTNRPTTRAGRFGGPLVVSMRPLAPEHADRAAEITARFPDMHGAPVHRGDPAALGIAALDRPDYGEAVAVLPEEVPVFWACGVTSQVAVEAAGLPFCIAHAPGKMLITDLRHPAT